LKVSIIIPTVRPDKVLRCVEAIHENSGVCLGDYEIIREIDSNKIGCPRMVKDLVSKAKYDWIMFLGDDTIPKNDFLKNALNKSKELPDGWGMVGLNDGIHMDNFSTHWMCHKNMLELTEGEFFHTGYIHQFCDVELTDIAKENGRYLFAEDSRLFHDHPLVTGNGFDSNYLKATSKDVHKKDRSLYFQRREIRTGKKYKLAIGLPVTNENVDILFFKSFIQLQLPETEIIYPKFGAHPGDIARVRNDIVKDAIYKNCTHILFMDTDQVYHDADLVTRLLDHDLDIVGGLVHRRYEPFEPILQRDGSHVPDEEINKGGLIPVDTTGTGCLLIKTDVFYNVESPYFDVERDELGNVSVGEDVHFCRKANKAGYQIYVDADVTIGHLTKLQIGKGFYEFFKQIARS
jgi:GT2 family glycosyltransferase